MPPFFRHTLLCLLLVSLLPAGEVWGQEPARRPPERRQSDAPPDTVLQIDRDNTYLQQRARDTLNQAQARRFYENVQAFCERRKVTRWVFDVLFRSSAPPGEPVSPTPKPIDKFRTHEGKVIRRVTIRRLRTFGPSVNDTSRATERLLGKWGNRLHTDTRRWIIRGDMLVREGDVFEPTRVRDTERLLRQASYLLDARVIPVSTEHADSVDLLVITQDIWSISADVGASPTDGSLTLRDRNLLGTANALSLQGRVHREFGWGYAARFDAPYLSRYLINARVETLSDWDRSVHGFRIDRPFLTPSTRYAGNLSYYRRWEYAFLDLERDTVDVRRVVTAFDDADAWFGRSFRLGFGDASFRERTRLVVAARRAQQHFRRRPEVRADTNQLFHNRATYLASVGFSERSYYRDVLVYGFGRTEDIPYGTSVVLTGGTERSEFSERPYLGGEVSSGRYHNHVGYVFWSVGAGSFFRKGRSEQGVLEVRTRYFSPLLHL
ncbi:MAG: hypothetical protein WBA12_12030, partial [Catalinimonas sp.]